VHERVCICVCIRIDMSSIKMREKKNKHREGKQEREFKSSRVQEREIQERFKRVQELKSSREITRV
jgi:hypothetical protein